MCSKEADVCAGALGDFGWWQLRAVLLVALVKVPSAWHMASILFTAPAPRDFWCARPSQFHDWDTRRWRQLVHPPLGLTGSRDPCNMYDVQTWASSSDQIPANATVRRCDQFEFEEGAMTVVTQWNLVCQREVLVNVSQFFYLLGIVVGGALCTQLLNRYSPRRIILMGMISQVIAGVAAAQAPQFELQVTLRFLTAVACANMFTSGYVICTDVTSGHWRLVTGACYEHMWSVGVVTLAGLGYLLENWSQLQLAISLPTIFILLAYIWIPDSPRWLIANGRAEEAKLILEQGAAFNRRNVSIPDISALSPKCEKTEVRWFELFGKPDGRWSCVALHVVWAASVVTYYGALLNVKNLGEHLYINTAIAGVAEVVGVLLGLVLMLWCCRKWLALGVVLLVGGGACIVSWALPAQGDWGREWAMLGLAMTGRVAIACSLTLLQVTSSELLPPDQRQLGMFSCVTFARICLLSAPFIGSLAMYGDCVSLSAFGGITFTGGLAALYIGRHRRKISHSEQEASTVQNVWSTEELNRPPHKTKSVELPEQNYGKFNKRIDQCV